MRKAKDFRLSARTALSGNYWWAVLVSLVAAILGAGMGGGIPSVSFKFSQADINSVLNGFQVNNWQDLQYAMQRLLESPLFRVGIAAALGLSGIVGIYSLAKLIIGGAVELGYDLYNVRLFTGEAHPFSTLFERFSVFGRALGLRLLTLLFVTLWALPSIAGLGITVAGVTVCIAGGIGSSATAAWIGVAIVLLGVAVYFGLLALPIVASYRYALAPYLMTENTSLGCMDAINRSKQIMHGNKGRLFCLNFSFIGWYILAGLTAGVGAIFLAPYVKAAQTSFYLDVMGRLNPSAGKQYYYQQYSYQNQTSDAPKDAPKEDAQPQPDGPEQI